MNLAALETALCSTFREESDHYAAALKLAEDLPATIQEGQDTQAQVQRILVRLDDIAKLEKHIAADRLSWAQSGKKAGPELAAAIAQLVQLIQQLIDRLHEAERAAAGRKMRLEPQLEDIIRGAQMRKAYGEAILSKFPSQ